jgi:hypothetical protein
MFGGFMKIAAKNKKCRHGCTINSGDRFRDIGRRRGLCFDCVDKERDDAAFMAWLFGWLDGK